MALAQEAGVEFLFDSTEEQVDVNGRNARGVMVDGRRMEADTVLANADLPYVYQNLLPQDGQAKRLTRKRLSCSVVSFFWGLDKPYELLAPHTLFLADDYKENFDSIIRDLDLPDNPSLYIHAPARLDPAMAPMGEDTMIAIVPVGHMSGNEDQDWARSGIKHGNSIPPLETLGITDLDEHIKFEINFTPLSWRKRYNLVKGSTHGLCHNLLQLGIFRPDLQHPATATCTSPAPAPAPAPGCPPPWSQAACSEANRRHLARTE